MPVFQKHLFHGGQARDPFTVGENEFADSLGVDILKSQRRAELGGEKLRPFAVFESVALGRAAVANDVRNIVGISQFNRYSDPISHVAFTSDGSILSQDATAVPSEDARRALGNINHVAFSQNLNKFVYFHNNGEITTFERKLNAVGMGSEVSGFRTNTEGRFRVLDNNNRTIPFRQFTINTPISYADVAGNFYVSNENGVYELEYTNIGRHTTTFNFVNLIDEQLETEDITAFAIDPISQASETPFVSKAYFYSADTQTVYQTDIEIDSDTAAPTLGNIIKDGAEALDLGAQLRTLGLSRNVTAIAFIWTGATDLWEMLFLVSNTIVRYQVSVHINNDSFLSIAAATYLGTFDLTPYTSNIVVTDFTASLLDISGSRTVNHLIFSNTSNVNNGLLTLSVTHQSGVAQGEITPVGGRVLQMSNITGVAVDRLLTEVFVKNNNTNRVHRFSLFPSDTTFLDDTSLIDLNDDILDETGDFDGSIAYVEANNRRYLINISNDRNFNVYDLHNVTWSPALTLPPRENILKLVDTDYQVSVYTDNGRRYSWTPRARDVFDSFTEYQGRFIDAIYYQGTEYVLYQDTQSQDIVLSAFSGKNQVDLKLIDRGEITLGVVRNNLLIARSNIQIVLSIDGELRVWEVGSALSSEPLAVNRVFTHRDNRADTPTNAGFLSERLLSEQGDVILTNTHLESGGAQNAVGIQYADTPPPTSGYIDLGIIGSAESVITLKKLQIVADIPDGASIIVQFSSSEDYRTPSAERGNFSSDNSITFSGENSSNVWTSLLKDVQTNTSAFFRPVVHLLRGAGNVSPVLYSVSIEYDETQTE